MREGTMTTLEIPERWKENGGTSIQHVVGFGKSHVLEEIIEKGNVSLTPVEYQLKTNEFTDYTQEFNLSSNNTKGFFLVFQRYAWDVVQNKARFGSLLYTIVVNELPYFFERIKAEATCYRLIHLKAIRKVVAELQKENSQEEGASYFWSYDKEMEVFSLSFNSTIKHCPELRFELHLIGDERITLRIKKIFHTNQGE